MIESTVSCHRPYPPLPEQLVGGDFGLDVVAVGVVGEAVGCYHGYVDGLSCPCLFDETSSFSVKGFKFILNDRRLCRPPRFLKENNSRNRSFFARFRELSENYSRNL